MFISGFTIIKNAVINDYPIIEAITSILPVVDEMVVLCGDSSDDTNELIASIKDPKIKIFHSVWNKDLKNGGTVLADETNKAFQLIDAKADWAFYIQADEAIHEKYFDNIKDACKKYKNDDRVQGLLFKYLHFYGTYDYVGDSRSWYNREVRIIKNNKKISSYKDAQGFRIGKTKLPVIAIDAFVYHYGWVKSPQQMRRKHVHVSRYWGADEVNEFTDEVFNFDTYDSLQKFTGTHPAVMQNRIEQKNWKVDIDPGRKKFSFKDKLLYNFEKITGIRLFDFKNHRVIR